MKYFIVVAALFTVSSAQGIIDQLNSRDNVLLTGYNQYLRTDNLQFAPADCSPGGNGTDFDTTILVYTRERRLIEFWGLEASFEAKKIWANNNKKSELKQIDLATANVRTVTWGLTRGLENIVYDRITEILYWTDSRSVSIRAMDLSYRHFCDVITFEDVFPFALGIHPVLRKMFYSSFKVDDSAFVSKTEIVKSNLDGSSRVAILKFPQVIRPRDLTINFQDNLIFWTDVALIGNDAVVMSSDFNGGNIKKFFNKEASFLWGIANYKSCVYVTDMLKNDNGKYDIHIRNSNGIGGVTRTSRIRPRNVVIYGPDETANTTVNNECENNKCEHICLAGANGKHVCKCTVGFQLVDEYRCESMEFLANNSLLIADVGQQRLFQLPIKSTAGSVGDLVAIDLDNHTDDRIAAVSVAKKTGELAWYDITADAIVWGDKRIAFPDPVRWITVDCCNKAVYWNIRGAIYSWDGKSSTYSKLYSLPFSSRNQIRTIAFDCKSDFLYWIEFDARSRTDTIRRIRKMGGTVTTVTKDLPMSYGIIIDYESYELRVLSSIEGALYSLKLNGLVPSPITAFTKVLLKSALEQEKIFFQTLTVLDGYLYFADDHSDAIYRYKLANGPSSLEKYGENTVFLPLVLDFYSSEYYETYLDPLC